MTLEDTNFYVYIYRDPSTLTPFYVGKGSHKRAFVHLHKSHNRGVKNKISKLKSLGMAPPPEIEVIDALNEDHAFLLEEVLIELFGRRDLKTGSLFNQTAGGEGFTGYFTEERRSVVGNRMRVFHNGRPKTEAQKINMSKAQKGMAKEVVTCHHCGTVGGINNMRRWHLERCRHNPSNLNALRPRRASQPLTDKQLAVLKNQQGKDHVSNTIWVNDGVRSFRVKECAYDVFKMKKGRLPRRPPLTG